MLVFSTSECTGPFRVTRPFCAMILTLCAFVDSDLSLTIERRILAVRSTSEWSFFCWSAVGSAGLLSRLLAAELSAPSRVDRSSPPVKFLDVLGQFRHRPGGSRWSPLVARQEPATLETGCPALKASSSFNAPRLVARHRLPLGETSLWGFDARGQANADDAAGRSLGHGNVFSGQAVHELRSVNRLCTVRASRRTSASRGRVPAESAANPGQVTAGNASPAVESP